MESSSNYRESGHQFVTLISADLEVTITPSKGCDIISIVDRRTGIDVMAKSPWGLHPPGATPHLGSSLDEWLYHYGGGWQLLLPNGGTECIHEGTTFGFHGEASLASWTVDATSTTEASFHLELYTTPIRVSRTITVDGSKLEIRESIHNCSPDAIEVMWSHHPAFGEPLIEPGTRIETSAATYWADPITPGSVGSAGTTTPWPATVPGPDGPVDLSIVPGPDQPRHSVGYLKDFDEHQVRVVNTNRDLAVVLKWDGDVFPHAWLWQELRFSAGYPWHQRMYTVAIEPATSVPGHGLANLADHGGTPLTVAPNTTRTAKIQLTTSPATETT